MKNIAKTIIIFTLFALGSFVVLSTPAEAAFPTIISATANIGTDKVVLNGSVNPNGYLTTAWFEYGTSNSLEGFKETTHLDIGAGTESSPFSGSVTDLDPGTTYYFRVVANNGQRITKSEILSFTTKISIAPVEDTAPPKEEVNNITDQKEEVNNIPSPVEEKKETKDTTVKDGTGLEANTLFSTNSKFLPSTLTGWLVLLLVILCTVFVGRKLYSSVSSTETLRKNL